VVVNNTKKYKKLFQSTFSRGTIQSIDSSYIYFNRYTGRKIEKMKLQSFVITCKAINKLYKEATDMCDEYEICLITPKDDFISKNQNLKIEVYGSIIYTKVKNIHCWKVLKRFKEYFKNGKILCIKNKEITFVRTGEHEPETFSLKHLARTITMLDNRFDWFAKKCDEYCMKMHTRKSDFVDTKQKIEVECTRGHVSLVSYLDIANCKRYQQPYLKNIFCPVCRQIFQEKNKYADSKIRRYSKYRNEELLEEAVKIYNKSEFPNQVAFRHAHSSLATIMDARNEGVEFGISLFNDFVRNHTSWIHRHPEVYEWSNQDWCSYLNEKKYMSVSDWKLTSREQYKLAIARKKPFWSELEEKFFPRKYIGYGDYKYDSYAELIFGNLLYISKIDFQIHGEWPFPGLANSEINACFDFEFSHKGKRFIVEIYMRTFESNDNSDRVVEYLKRRKDKEKKIHKLINEKNKSHINYIPIEAYVMREHGSYIYYKYIVKLLKSFGVILKKVKHEDLLYSKSFKNVIDMDIDELLQLYIDNGWTTLSQAPYIIRRKVAKKGDSEELRIKLDKLHGRKIISNSSNRIDVDALRKFCSQNGINTKKEYEKAYKKGMLPEGAPANIRQTYYVQWSSFFGRVANSELIRDYNKAKQIVQKLGFQSKTEFENAVREKHPDLKYILKSPGNTKSGGYVGWVNWADFLGYDL
jgi:hypothetical protein